MQAIQLRLLLSLCAVTLTTMAVADTTTDAPPSDAAPKSASEQKQQKQQKDSTAISSTQKPATLSGKQQRQRQADIFKPTEQISEDFAAPMPVDI